jgi:cation:H+ antiporter
MFLVFFGALIFVNAIEFVAHKRKLGHSFVGAILVPFFTTIPELTIFLIAVFGVGQRAGEEVAVGTIFGQPFMVSSLSYGLVGIAALVGFLVGRRDKPILLVHRTLAIPYLFTTVLFPLTLVPSILGASAAVRYLFGLMFLGAFLVYVRSMFRRRNYALVEEGEDCYLHKYFGRVFRRPFGAALIQLVVASLGLYLGSNIMISSVIALAEGFKMEPLALALIVIPAATAIPETTGALIWGFRGKDTLSLGALVGEKILFSTIYPALGLFFTSWALDDHAEFSVLATTVVSFALLVFILKRKMPWWSLCLGFFFFVTYAVLIFAYHF